MVNFLETLYGVTALAFVAALVQLLRRQRSSAQRFAIAGAVGVVCCVLLYRALS